LSGPEIFLKNFSEIFLKRKDQKFFSGKFSVKKIKKIFQITGIS